MQTTATLRQRLAEAKSLAKKARSGERVSSLPLLLMGTGSERDLYDHEMIRSVRAFGMRWDAIARALCVRSETVRAAHYRWLRRTNTQPSLPRGWEYGDVITCDCGCGLNFAVTPGSTPTSITFKVLNGGRFYEGIEVSYDVDSIPIHLLVGTRKHTQKRSA